MFVVVNFDALAQASDIQIERRQVVFLCWKQDLNPGLQTPIRQQTECSLTNRLSYRGSSYKTWTRQPVPMISEHSAHSAPLSVDFRTWLWRYTCLLLLMSMLWHRQAIFKSKGAKLCSSAESRIWTRDPRHQFASRLNARWQTDWAIEDQAIKLELDSPSLWSASIQPTRPHCQLTFAPQMDTFPRYWPFVKGINRPPTDSPHKGQWRGALVFSLVCAWRNGSENNRDSGDFRRHRAHNDVTVMIRRMSVS